jgi:RNAse G (EC 3.1.4.-)
VVQVVKDPIGTKGARLTTQISIPSRYLVLLPQSRSIGISARIEDEDERQRLKSLVAELSAAHGGHGYIVRTNAEGQPAEALAEDIAYLARVWNAVERRGREAAAGTITYEDLSLPLRSVRDLVRRDVEKVRSIRATPTIACRRSSPSTCRCWPRRSSCTPATVRSSTCMGSRTRSAAPWTSRCRSSPAATW